jgi:hypothetical protein
MVVGLADACRMCCRVEIQRRAGHADLNLMMVTYGCLELRTGRTIAGLGP